jgi:hypothetical protein
MSEPDRSHYMVEASVLHQVGPAPALIHAILVANADDGMVSMTYKQIAELAGVRSSSARWNIKQLRDAGLLKSEADIFNVACQGDGTTRWP